MKRLLGRRYTDETVQWDINHWPFTIVDVDGYPQVAITSSGAENILTAEELSAMVLTKMKETAEAYLETKVDKAVISVPAYFTNYQRAATLEAAQLAGLKVLRLVNEPTAAAIAYAVTKQEMSGTVLVFDLGGGTLDVSIITIIDRQFTVKTTSGDTHLGGEDFSNSLIDYVIDLFQKKHNKQIRNNKRAISRVKRECEKAKKKLSFSVRAKVFVDCLVDGIDCDEEITRDKFDELNADLFQSALGPVADALRSVDMTKDDIDKIIMVGGSSRIPKIKNLLQEFFGNKEVCCSINPDEAVAYGAGICAAIHSGIDIRDCGNFIIKDIVPMALGIGVGENFGKYSIVIEKNATIPISMSRTYETLYDNQTAISIRVYEGSDPNTRRNKFLGTFSIKEVPPRPKGEEKFEVIFSININGILEVYAKNLSTGNDGSIVIERKF